MANKAAGIAIIGAGMGLGLLALFMSRGQQQQCTLAFYNGMQAAFGSRPGAPNWDPKYDLNHDGVIDIKDAVILINSCPGGFT